VQDLAACLESRLNQTLSPNADVEEVAGHIVSLWRDITITFASVVGKRGVAALIRRSLSLTLGEFPWLSAALTDPATEDELAGLGHTLAQHPGADASAANSALLRNFLALLASLIGAALTERLLRQALDTTRTGASQEKPT
jgi:hypothetical protein